MGPGLVSDIVYLYGFVPAETALPPSGLAGVADRAVELWPFDGFAAAVARLPAEEYSTEVIEPRFSDLQWVAGQGVEHERVVAWFVDHAQILPVRLLTLYSTRTALAADVESRATMLRGQLERFRGLREWDLKVSYRSEILLENIGSVSDEIAGLDRQIAEAAPGKRFLLERKRADQAKIEVASAARRLAAALLEMLRPFAEQVETIPSPRDSAELPVVLNAALLVRLEQEAGLRAAIAADAARLQPLGMELTFSGPWAPYRFLAAQNQDGSTHGV